MSRPKKLTTDTQKIIVDAIQLGSTYLLASQAAGIAYNTFNEWMKAGEEANSGIVREFYESVKKAEGQRVARWLSKIEAAANEGTWQAAAWKLERIHPDDFAAKNKMEHSGPGGGPIEVKKVKGYATFSPDDWDNGDKPED